MTRITITIALLLSLSGCGIQNLLKSNQQALTDAATQLSGPVCTQIATSLQPAENASVCQNLTACTASFCTPAK